jgi:glycerol-3-phosphate dehydrogenase (NAD(P)+)
MTTKIAILGSGAMATACSILLAERPDQAVTIWGRNPDHAAKIQKDRVNERLLPGIRLPDKVEVTADLDQALKDASFLVAAIPTPQPAEADPAGHQCRQRAGKRDVSAAE